MSLKSQIREAHDKNNRTAYARKHGPRVVSSANRRSKLRWYARRGWPGGVQPIMRTPELFVSDLFAHGRSPEQIKAVASVTRWRGCMVDVDVAIASLKKGMKCQKTKYKKVKV